MAEQEYYSAKEVAKILSISKDTVLDMAKAGKLPYIEIGLGVKALRKRFPRKSIDGLLVKTGAEGSPRLQAAEDGEQEE